MLQTSPIRSNASPIMILCGCSLFAAVLLNFTSRARHRAITFSSTNHMTHRALIRSDRDCWTQEQPGGCSLLLITEPACVLRTKFLTRIIPKQQAGFVHSIYLRYTHPKRFTGRNRLSLNTGSNFHYGAHHGVGGPANECSAFILV